MGSVYMRTYAAHGCPELSSRAFRVLMRMACVCQDEDTAPGTNDEGLYYGGWKGVTVPLGFGVYDRDDELPRVAERAIARAVAELKAAGYLTLAEKQYQRVHWNRVYRLHLPSLATRPDVAAIV